METPVVLAKIGIPTTPPIKYKTTAAKLNRLPKKIVRNVTVVVCKVNGMGPNGMAILALIASKTLAENAIKICFSIDLLMLFIIMFFLMSLNVISIKNLSSCNFNYQVQPSKFKKETRSKGAKFKYLAIVLSAAKQRRAWMESVGIYRISIFLYISHSCRMCYSNMII